MTESRRARANPKADHPYHHGDLRAALVDAAYELVERDGADALSLREVARRVGVSHAAPKHHFRDKAALLAAVGARAFDELAATMEQARRRAGDDPLARLTSAGVAYVSFAASHPALFRSMFGGALAGAADAEVRARSRRAFEVLVDAASHAAGPSATPAELRVLVTAAWSAVHGLSLLWLDGRLGRRARAGGGEAIGRLATEVTGLLAEAVRRRIESRGPRP